MNSLKLLNESVYYFFKWLDLLENVHIPCLCGFDSKPDYLLNGVAHNVKLVFRLLRKTDLLFIKNIRSFIDVYSIVTYSLIL